MHAAATSPPRADQGAAARGLSRPTVLESLRELAAVAGGVGALDLWSRAAAASGAYGMEPDVGSHIRAVNWLAEHAESPAARTVAHSIAARLRVYRVLASMEGVA